MPKVRGTIPNMVNGISQQAPDLRLTSQSEDDVNTYPMIVDGLMHRPPSQHLGEIGDADIATTAFAHIIRRDDTEKYVVTIEADRTLRVHDFSGVEKTVNIQERTVTSLDAVTSAATGDGYQVYLGNADTDLDIVTTGISGDTVVVETATDAAFTSPSTVSTITTNTTTTINPTSGNYYRARVSSYSAGTITATLVWNDAQYLAGITTPRDELKCLTVADHTFIVNKTKTVAARSETKTSRPYEAVIHVITGNYGKYYRIFIGGVEKATYQTPDGGTASHSNNIDTVFIANELYNDLVTAGYNTGNWSVARYHSTIYLSNSNADFTVSCEDGYSNNSMKAIKDTAADFNDLPAHNTEGFTVKVAGPEGIPDEDYWVEFEWSAGSGSEGTYRETVAPGSQLGFDQYTMPHVLVREANGTFTFKPISWGDKRCGDDVTVPHPSFVGQTIDDVIFHRKRLGLLTEENVVFSEVGAFYEFYRTSLTALLDTDPIDISADHVKVSLLRHAVPFQDVLILFSDQTQFRLAGNELLTPKTVAARPLTEHTVAAKVQPVGSGSNLYFIAESNSWAQLYEYYVDKAVETAEADSVSGHAPVLIPAGCRYMIAHPDLDILFIQTDGDPDSLFVYKYYVANNEKLQSAWVRWEFPEVTEIVALGMDKSYLICLFRRGSRYFLERINLEQGQREKIHLDRRTVIATGSYDSGTDQTTYSAPYTMPTTYNLVTAAGGALPLGVELAASSLVVEGDQSAQPVYVGIPYESIHQFSTQFYRDPQSQGKVAITDGRLQLLNMTLSFSKTNFFQVEVEPASRDPITYTFSGWRVGDPLALTGELPQVDGRFAVPILSRNDRVSIKVKNNTWRGYALTSATWRGIFNPHSREL